MLQSALNPFRGVYGVLWRPRLALLTNTSAKVMNPARCERFPKEPVVHRLGNRLASLPDFVGPLVWRVVFRTLLLLGFASGFSPSRAEAPARTQQIGLSQGWNLISLQVGAHWSLGQIEAGIDEPNVLQSVWAYEATHRKWLGWQPASTGYPSDLNELSSGHGYWVQVSKSCTLTLAGLPWSGPVEFSPGWNLVGFPGLSRMSLDLPNFSSVFRTNVSRFPQIWTWDAGTAQRFTGYDSQSIPPLTNLTSIAAGRGYWVYSLETLSLAAQPQILLSPDVDNPPLETNTLTVGDITGPRANTNANTADLDLNGNGILDSAATQTAMDFPAGVNEQLITIVNNGLGMVDWAVVENIPWLAVNGTNAVVGLVTAENESLRITVDRTGYKPGIYTASFDVYAGSVHKGITVVLHVAPVDGDYRGYATTTRVNGQPLSIGAVDLNLTLFRKSTNITEKDFRGVISREQSLLFPRDVYLSGTFFQDTEFFITSNFEVPAGDRNLPPYTQFTHLNGDATFGDRDWNGDGRLDASNPFPFPLRREITLIGKYVNDSLLQGAYYETIQNIVPGQPIAIEGEFTLTRSSLSPTLTTVENHPASTNIIIGAESPRSSSSTLEVTRYVTIQSLSVVVNLDFALGSDVTGTLIGPNGTNTVLFTEGFSGSRTFKVTDFNKLDAHGSWTLRVSWSPNGERGYFNGWNFSVQGLQVHTVSGNVLARGAGSIQPVIGSHVTLTGNLFTQQRLLTNSNSFVFESLTENGFLLTVTAPGYQDFSTRFNLINDNVDLGDLFLLPVTNTEPTLVVAPMLGGEILHVNFTPLIPLDFAASLGSSVTSRWDFGDGVLLTNIGPSVAPVPHDYRTPGYYTARLFITGSSVSTNLTTGLITVLSQGSPVGTNLVQVSAVSFIGSVASPGPGVSQDVNAVLAGIGTTNGIEFATFYQESKRDVAAFDIDRYPFIPVDGKFSPGSEDSDFYLQTGTPWFNSPLLWDQNYDAAQGDGVFKAYPPPDRPPATKPTRFRVSCTLGGTVFAEEPSRVGLYTIQAGRIEP